ncbi:flagellar basal-body MS-ring/collar protein FliF [Sulfitobacter donghicola]|uniref:Flagellar M-ring protein n=1 Tax=Sulfitobacter donghicola DSW-25 = KCTC 12864 = JCM 14565 TaxID=1300350 RepID=A0A073ILW6_9RHOB|nr:flagellar basal-body MS-ring/collar protein FliF [Sulfitobacter donghicola]KEJ90540.1 flagellar M-ring protein FliF [Sulfitobacter donghicola DSW-25 = KCTC 12864 = JCM 14565]KIN67783.1 Flagellar M-ring protein FliF [Sulfitobacter donghicola DSW-25 = KCTC 12864 = JCM 14565]
MQQYLNVWLNLGLKRQLIVIATTGAMFFAILTMARMTTAPSMTLLYAGLESSAAGDVVRSLEQRGVVFEVRGGSIYVDNKERDQLRLTLASEGLPANGNRGYELLDQLTGFGTTSQMFDAAYWRAKEGELARTIVANPAIAMARVHIASTGSNPFQRGVTPKASVSLTPNGGGISPAQGKAVRFLVASAVAGLAPEDVAVIDANGSLIGATEETAPTVGGDDKAKVLRDRVQRLLEARVGFGNAVVEVSVDTVTESEAIREHRFDPEGRVAISSDTEERTNTAEGTGGGDVTVASNLPDQGGDGGGDKSSSQNSETRERINYEVSETEREIIRAPGAIKRLSVAVLVNETTALNDAGQQVSQPRDPEEMEALRELVSSAVGFDEERGDIITLKSMALQSVAPSGTAASTSLMDQFDLDLLSAIQMVVLAVVTLILGLFVIRPVLSRDISGVPALDDSLAGASFQPERSVQSGENNLPAVLEAEVLENGVSLPSQGAVVQQPVAGEEETTLEDPVARLRNMIGDRQDETVEILRGWLEDKEKA